MSTTYDVFARKEHAEPLVYIGSVEAESDEAVVAVSLETYGDKEWVEMVTVAHDKMVIVFSEEEAVR